MLFKKQKFDWLLVGLLVVGLFLFASYQPRFRLRPVMPPDFIDEPLARASQNPNPEGKVASAYWSCLASTIQWQYGYGHTLPADPPPDFTATLSGMTADDTTTRIRYWHRAQHIWYLPTAWQKDYEWNFEWTTDWVRNGGDLLNHVFARLGN
ncbi:MAG: hypothetical protein ACRD23_02585 [Terriglobales bacterium]